MPTVSLLDENKAEKTFEVNASDIIFNALEVQGFTLPHGCLAGSCGSCKIEIVEGENNLSALSPVEKDTIDCLMQKLPSTQAKKIIRLSCRAKVLGNIHIALLK